jgi:hypothetical protein
MISMDDSIIAEARQEESVKQIKEITEELEE